MILLAGVLVLAAVVLLVLGLTQESPVLQWASFAASALAALAVAGGEVRRHLAARGAAGPRADPEDEWSPVAAPPAAPAQPRPVDPPTSVVPAAEPQRQRPPSQEQPRVVPPRRAQPVHEPPTQAPPVQEPPTQAPPAYDPPAYDPPGYQPPSYDPPAYEPPSYEPPSYSPRGYSPPAYEPPSHQPATYDPPSYSPPSYDPPSYDPPAAGPAAAVPAAAVPAAGGGPAVVGADGEPPVEEVEVTDLLVVLDLHDEVLVVDEHPRYHLAGCPHLAGVDTFPLPMVEARTDGFTPCGTCAPDRNLARVERARRSRG
ncbi:hypothetical protein [Modestobacter sp. URMC 112]